MADIRLQKLAKLLVHYSTKIQSGEFVFIMANDAAIPWMVEVAKEAAKAGAHVETLIRNEDVEEAVLKYGDAEMIKKSGQVMKAAMEKADVFLSAWGGRNTRVNTNISSEKMTAAAIGGHNWRAVYFRKTDEGTMRWCGTQFPTQSDAQEASMSLSDYEDFVYGAGLMNSENPAAEWERISKEQERWINYLDGKKELHIVSQDTDIKVKVDGRKWINCDGKENFPDGEIFTSPVEDSINGHITFSYPAIYLGKMVEGVRLEVKDGKVIKAEAKKGQKFLNATLNTDEGSSFFGEVAIGTNYGIKKFTKNILFDEKIGGTIHMAVGQSFGEAGGKNKSSIHWDMICDMTKGGCIYADGELFYENGIFKEEILEKYNL